MRKTFFAGVILLLSPFCIQGGRKKSDLDALLICKKISEKSQENDSTALNNTVGFCTKCNKRMALYLLHDHIRECEGKG